MLSLPRSGHQNSWELGERKPGVGWVTDLYIWRETPGMGGQHDPHGERLRASSRAGEVGGQEGGAGLGGTTLKGTCKSP